MLLLHLGEWGEGRMSVTCWGTRVLKVSLVLGKEGDECH